MFLDFHARTSHRIVVALASAAALVGAPAMAHAEWDIGQYDRCVANVKFQYREGDISTMDMVNGYNVCCTSSGGRLENGNCTAPPAVAANTPSVAPSQVANPDVPAGPAPGKPRNTFTPAPIAPGG